MISCSHAYRLNQTGKSSLMEVYHDNENHDNEHQNDWKTFHGLKAHYIRHPRHITTNFQTPLGFRNPLLESKWALDFENPCQTIQNNGKNVSQYVRKTIGWKRLQNPLPTYCV